MADKISTSFYIPKELLTEIRLVSEIMGITRSKLATTILEKSLPLILLEAEEKALEDEAKTIQARSLLYDYKKYTHVSSLFGLRKKTTGK